MAILKSVLGTFNQSMGGVTFSNWKGKNVAKQKVPANNTSNTRLQMTQRTKFSAIAQLGGKAGPSIRLGLKDAATDVTELNVFQRLNRAAVVVDEDVVATILADQLVFAQGIVPEITLTAATINAGTGNFHLTWFNDTDGNSKYADDQVNLVVYDITGDKVYNLLNIGTRADGATGVTYPGFNGLNPAFVAVYVFAKRKSSSATSKSVYRLTTGG